MCWEAGGSLEHEIAAASPIAGVLGGVTASAPPWWEAALLCPLPFTRGALASSWHASLISSHLPASLLLACPMSVWLKCFWLFLRGVSQTPQQKVLVVHQAALGKYGEDGCEHQKPLLAQLYFFKD